MSRGKRNYILRPTQVKEKCKALRKKGFSYREISNKTNIPKTTIYDWTNKIYLSKKSKKRIQNIVIKGIQKANTNRVYPRRKIRKPKEWSAELISTIAHFMFDGTIRGHYCSYYSKDQANILRMQKNVLNLFKIKPITRNRNGVISISYFYTELAEYVENRAKRIISHIKKAPKKDIVVFLKAFFDDEGSVCFEYKRVRGYQHSSEILKLIKHLLSSLGIKSKINKDNTEITIPRKNNLIKYKKLINFSPGIYINPNRKNSVWKKKLLKSKILDLVINSYKK